MIKRIEVKILPTPIAFVVVEIVVVAPGSAVALLIPSTIAFFISSNMVWVDHVAPPVIGSMTMVRGINSIATTPNNSTII